MKGQHSSTMKDAQKGNFASTPRRMVSVDTQVNDGQVNQRQDEQEEATAEARPTLIGTSAADIIGPDSEASTGGRTSVSSLSTAATSSPSSDYWSKRHLKDRKSRRSQMSSTTRGSRSAAAKEGATATTTRAPAGPSSSSLDVMTTTPGAFHVTPSRIDAIRNTQEEQSALPSAPKDDEAEEEEEPVIDDKILDETPILESTAQIVQAELAPDTSAIVAQEVQRQVQKELQRHYNNSAITNSDEILVVAATTKVLPSNDEETDKTTTAPSRTNCCYLNKCWICFTSLLFILVLILGLTVTMMLRNGDVDTGNNENNSQLSTPPPEDLDVLLPTMSPTSSLRGSVSANSPTSSPTSELNRSNYCSSTKEQVGMTLQSWYFGHEDGRGSGKANRCEELCRQDERCDSWMWRNSGNTCYLSEDSQLKEIPSGGGCCTDHHVFTFNEANCNLIDESPSPSPSFFPPAVHAERQKYCSSPEQESMTLRSWYFGHTNGGGGLWSQCEKLCRDDPRCNTWMGRNSGNTCYLSKDTTLKPMSGTCCSDHHAHTFNLGNCNDDDDSWEVIPGGGIEIGPGSYYTQDEALTVVKSDIDQDAMAWEVVHSYDSTDNPIVMWQLRSIPNGDGGAAHVELWAHRLQFMYQNLDEATGSTPHNFAQATADFIESTQGPGNGGIVHVRSDLWWQDNKKN